MEKNCVICNVIFNAKRSDAEVCSQKCRQKHWRNKLAQPSIDRETITMEISDFPEWAKLNGEKTTLELINKSLEAEIARLKSRVDNLLLEVSELKKQPYVQPMGTSSSGIITIGQKVESWKAEIKTTTWSGDLQKIMGEVKKSDLPDWAKKQLQTFSDHHRTEFTN